MNLKTDNDLKIKNLGDSVFEELRKAMEDEKQKKLMQFIAELNKRIESLELRVQK